MKLSPKVAKIIAVGMLGSAVVWARYERRAIPADSIALDTIPRSVANWSCVGETQKHSYGPEVKTIIREYRGPDGIAASVNLQGTYTRLGGLRDWSLARTTGGWTVIEEEKTEVAVSGTERIEVRVERLERDDNAVWAVSWYTSPTSQAAELSRAEFAAWRDRLVGRKVPWMSLYVTVPVPTGAWAERASERALELTRHLAPELRKVAAQAAP